MAVRRTFWALLALLAVACLAGYYVPSALFPIPAPLVGRTYIRIFTRLIAIAAGLIAVGWIWAYFSLAAFSMRREARVLRQQVGQIFEERFRIINWLFRRVYIEIRDESSLPGNFGSRVLSIGPNQQRSYVSYTLLNKRGYLN
jgi:hypothetical protein